MTRKVGSIEIPAILHASGCIWGQDSKRRHTPHVADCKRLNILLCWLQNCANVSEC